VREEFQLWRGEAVETGAVEVRHLVIAGWTGRDRRAVKEHVEELRALGVPAPSTTPLFYRVSASRLTIASEIETLGEGGSGEVETVLVRSGGSTWVGVGSDHTDRTLETIGVAVSKQVCDKPIAPELWPFDEVIGHWDSLVLRSWVMTGEEEALYQEGTAAALLDPRELIERYSGGTLSDETAMFCGTLPAIGGVRPSERFAIELQDPVLGRVIRHGYSIRVLPVVS
jgi:biotin operon repressor